MQRNQSVRFLRFASSALLLGLTFLHPAISMSQDKPIKIDILAEEFWPYSFTVNGSDKPQGVFIDFAIELLEEAGLDYSVNMLPWPRVMRRATTEANQLLVALIRSQEREDIFHWVGAVAEVNHALYGLNELSPVPQTLEEASLLTVATVVDDVASEYLQRSGFTNLTRTSDHLRGLELLSRGRVDLYPGNSLLIEYQCIQIPRGCENLMLVLPLEELEQDLYFALSLGTDEDVIASILENFTALIASGRLEILQETFLRSQAPELP